MVDPHTAFLFILSEMLFSKIILAVCAAALGVNASILPRDELDELNAQGIDILKQFEASNLEKRSGGKCTLANVGIRRDWYFMLHLLRQASD